MVFPQWLQENWFTLLESAGIIGSLLFTAISLRDDMRSRQTGNLIAITQHHREIWTHLFTRPELSRVLDANADVMRSPVTNEEELFVHFLILHLNSSYHAMRDGVFKKPDRLRQDIQAFFSLPIPRVVWLKTKPLQDDDFVSFVETSGDSA